MAENKKSFLLYCDVYGLVKQLPNELAGELFKHILSYVNDENPISENLILNIAFEPIKQQLKRDLIKYEGIKAKNKENILKRWNKENTTVYDRIPEPTKNTDNDTVTDNDNDTVTDNDINKKDGYFLKNNIKPEKKEKEKKHNGGGLDLSEFPTEFITVWKTWKTYKKEKHKFTFLNAESEKRSIQELLNIAKNDTNQCEKIINQSIDNGWKGLFEIKQIQINGKSNTSTESYKDRTARELDAIFAKRYGHSTN
mgnify:CR=1 FL=1